MNKHFDYFLNLLGTDFVKSDTDSLENYGKDRTKQFPSNATLILFPKTTDDVSSILKYANQHNIHVVPSGGRTGLSGAAVASNNEIIISLEKCNKIISFDAISGTVEVESGVILENLQNFVGENGYYFPLDFAAKGSAMIGGCISTNAGGIKVVKYGMTRDLVVGLEIVLANGDILNLNRNLFKDNSGYALTQLFIGAEGTLGIITKARLKCVQKPKGFQLACFAVDLFSNIPKILELTRKKNFPLLAFEFFSNDGKEIVLNHQKSISDPFDENYPYYVLIELESENTDSIEELMSLCAENELILNATIAQNNKEFKSLWALRENISESISLTATVHKNDISVPVSNLSAFIPDLESLINNKYNDYQLILFGHIADGNIHVNILNRNDIDDKEFRSKCYTLDMEMFDLIKLHHGSISAEHGVGLLKKDGLKDFKSNIELDYMRKIKKIFDENLILNPNKIFNN